MPKQARLLLSFLVKPASIFTMIGGLVGYGIGFVQFNITIYHSQIKLAEKHHSMYMSDEVGKAGSELDKFWLDETIITSIKNTPPEKRNDEIKNLIIYHKLGGSVAKLLEFYRGVVTCVQMKACDLDTTCNLFRKDIRAFLSTYRGYLRWWSALWHEEDIVGAEIRKFVKSSCVADKRSTKGGAARFRG